VANNKGSYGFSDEFDIWAIEVIEPDSETVWITGDINTEVIWGNVPGSHVRLVVCHEGDSIGTYSPSGEWIDASLGSYTRAGAIPSEWGWGSGYQVRIIDINGNIGWSEEFVIHYFPEIGLVAYYKLDGDATDETGNHNGSVHGATYVPDGKINGCYDFDGVNDYIDTNYSPSNLSELSISFWMKPESNPPSSAQYLIGVTTGGSHDLGMQYVLPDNTIRGFVRTLSGNSIAYTDVIPDTDWHHIVLTWKRGDSVKMYFDGLLCDATSAYNETNTYADLFIGALNNSGSPSSHLFKGKIDEVGLWERELLSEEVVALYSNGFGLSYP